MQQNNFERACAFIQNVWKEGGAVTLKAEGSTPAVLGPSPAGTGEWSDERLSAYLLEEVRLPNFQRAMRGKGYGSIFLISPHGGSVLHIRVPEQFTVVFNYVE